MDADEARVYIDAWVEAVSDDELDQLSDEDAIGIAERHWAEHVGDYPN